MKEHKKTKKKSQNLKKKSAVKISLDNLNSANGKISEFEQRKIEIS